MNSLNHFFLFGLKGHAFRRDAELFNRRIRSIKRVKRRMESMKAFLDIHR